jgi:hypothetical protein
LSRNNGTCIELNSTISGTNGTRFECDCAEGYTGINCELTVNLCANISCANNGICKTTNMAWKCICLDPTLYYGEYCQIQTTALQVKKTVSKSFASIAITAIVLTCSFIVLMDILKYGFHVDPIKTERMLKQQEAQAEKEAKRVARSAPKVAVRFQYVA